MKSPSAAVALADQIEQRIYLSRQQPDSVLAFENELQAQFGTGRSVVRQAIRILVQRGVVYTRRGKGGGTLLAKLDPEAASRALSVVLEGQLTSMSHIAELLDATDSHLFSNRAPRIGIAQCEELRSLVKHLDGLAPDEFLRVGAHRQVQVALRNAFGDAAASLAQRTCMDCGIDLIPYAVHVAEEQRRGGFWDLTLQLVEALIAGDVSLMFEIRLMQRRMWEENWPQLLDVHETRDRERSARGDLSGMERESGETGAVRLAREILRDVHARGWKVGERLGSAQELMQRYGASPGLLRQAVRMLEEYSAVHMQRGRNGGLQIAAPDEGRAIQRAVGYLQSAGVRPDDLKLYLDQLLLVALNHGAQAASVEQLGALRTSVSRILSSRGQNQLATGVEFSLALAELSANPALKLFVRVLLASLPPGAPKRPLSPDTPAILTELLHAITTSDVPKARRAFLQYVNPANALPLRG
jgi:DNA-binding FadR family transcriptional regulator